ncbi:MAG: PPOX class F420-dependent oxidoreductase [Dehalococcoidia bacterium]|nr:PPOX class F420-dependent oxidoreductase [Chloroflexota bacterium]
MLPEKVRAFVSQNIHGVITTFRKNGAAQMSIISCGPFRDGVAFTTTGDRAKLRNLIRNPKCSLMVSQPDWWGYVVLEGHAELLSPGKTSPEELRMALRDVYRVAGGGEHPNWEEYDQAMRDEQRSVVVVVPDHVYGTKA